MDFKLYAETFDFSVMKIFSYTTALSLSTPASLYQHLRARTGNHQEFVLRLQKRMANKNKNKNCIITWTLNDKIADISTFVLGCQPGKFFISALTKTRMSYQRQGKLFPGPLRSWLGDRCNKTEKSVDHAFRLANIELRPLG